MDKISMAFARWKRTRGNISPIHKALPRPHPPPTPKKSIGNYVYEYSIIEPS